MIPNEKKEKKQATLFIEKKMTAGWVQVRMFKLSISEG